jgi:hypothetical protein
MWRGVHNIGTYLENLRNTGYFTQDVGDDKANRDDNCRQQAKFQHGMQLNSLQPYGNKNNDRNMNYVYCIALL